MADASRKRARRDDDDDSEDETAVMPEVGKFDPTQWDYLDSSRLFSIHHPSLSGLRTFRPVFDGEKYGPAAVAQVAYAMGLNGFHTGDPNVKPLEMLRVLLFTYGFDYYRPLRPVREYRLFSADSPWAKDIRRMLNNDDAYVTDEQLDAYQDMLENTYIGEEYTPAWVSITAGRNYASYDELREFLPSFILARLVGFMFTAARLVGTMRQKQTMCVSRMSQEQQELLLTVMSANLYEPIVTLLLESGEHMEHEPAFASSIITSVIAPWVSILERRTVALRRMLYMEQTPEWPVRLEGEHRALIMRGVALLRRAAHDGRMTIAWLRDRYQPVVRGAGAGAGAGGVGVGMASEVIGPVWRRARTASTRGRQSRRGGSTRGRGTGRGGGRSRKAPAKRKAAKPRKVAAKRPRAAPRRRAGARK
jgi:hypothetical protein